jgi:hypothetical protein
MYKQGVELYYCSNSIVCRHENESNDLYLRKIITTCKMKNNIRTEKECIIDYVIEKQQKE